MRVKNENSAILRNIGYFGFCLGLLVPSVHSLRAQEGGEIVPVSTNRSLPDLPTNTPEPVPPVVVTEAAALSAAEAEAGFAAKENRKLDGGVGDGGVGLAVGSDLEAPDLEVLSSGGFEREDRWEEMFRGEPVARAAGGEFFSRVRVDVDIATEVVYDDNVLLARPGEEVADVIFRFRPGVVLGIGDSELREASFLQLSYRPTGSVFLDLSSENSFDHDIEAVFGHRGSRLEVTFDVGYRTVTEATIDVSTRAQRKVFDTGLLMEYALGAKVGLRGEAGYVVEEFDLFSGYEEWQSDIYLTYAVGGKTELGIGYGGGQLSPENGVDQRYQRALLRADWQATETFALAVSGGADFRRVGDESETTGVYGVEFGGQIRAGTGVRLNLERGIGASALQQSESFVRTALTVGIDQRLGHRLTTSLSVGLENYDYDSDGETVIARTDRSWFVRPGIRYQLRDDLSANIYYAYRENNSSNDLFDFNKNEVGASVRYQF